MLVLSHSQLHLHWGTMQVMRNEAVHPIRGWEDLKRRLHEDRWESGKGLLRERHEIGTTSANRGFKKASFSMADRQW
eukprot:1155891-Pelagomonas_calceolata.AAC.4